jgi:hypothetical protein
MMYEDASRPVTLYPDPDVHKAMVLLRRADPGVDRDDVWAVVCPACHFGAISEHGDLRAAIQAAFTHRLDNLMGSDLDELFGA